MKKVGATRDNERSWAIDLISKINSSPIVSQRDSMIQHAGGEMGLSTGSGSLFPDVLLFGDKGKTRILQGWELKYPDTPIDDRELFLNAIKKAELLGVNSFLLWNVSIAKLYVKSDKSEQYDLLKEWDDLKHITKRSEVAHHTAEINQLLKNILKELEYYFRNDTLRTEKILNSIVNEPMLSLAFSNIEDCAQSLRAASTKESEFYDEVLLWWEAEGLSYGKKANQWIELSRLAITSLMNKFIFANILKKYNSHARLIEQIDDTSTIEECLEVLRVISEKCDFYNIFEEKPGERHIDSATFKVLTHFNDYIMKLDFNTYSDKLLEELLSVVVTRSKRKVAGQFSTPKELAMILTALTMTDKSARISDPCCGTGTIVKAAYDLKTLAGISGKEAIEQIWAGDKFRYPLQFAMLALSSPENLGVQLNVYKEDVFNLKENQKVALHSPISKEMYEVELGKFDVIVSNLPFVQQETLSELNLEARIFIEDLNETFNGRSDLYAYIAIKIDELLTEKGTAGLIVSNSWLGTEFGDKFFNELKKRYHVKYIVTSGKGRWFQNADVVTNIIVLEKGNTSPDKKVNFVTLKGNLREIVGDGEKDQQYEKVSTLIAKIRRQRPSDEYVCNSYSYEQIDNFDQLGVIKNALFADCNWLFDFKDRLVPLTDYFHVKRGERRGWNPLFYPKEHNIESDYIVPVMKKLDSSSYIMNLDASIEGFSCSKTMEELEALNHKGALSWIRSFEAVKNGKGQLLKKSLAKKNVHWYEMSIKSSFDIGLLINPDERLFFSKAEQPVFFDQRLTGLVRKDPKNDLNLLAALLNSIVGIYFIEAIGFGRGLGVLDLNKNKVEDRFKMLDPQFISAKNKSTILDRYRRLEERQVLPLLEELQQDDRQEFDMAVLKAFGLEAHYEKIKNSLIQMFATRKSVR
ncbi:N-6 DNA methylase [Alkalihalobacterium elongatum]|uniref:N-6 DNA methylase n=1 Tax=Alkalihalobacterium elongatum TaxID=2675466 RepID=UPI001C1F8FDD|nr:N-6 DNA methylase [Alkalihalobacterium elongatum]